MKELSIWSILTQLLYSSSSGLEFSPRDFPDFPSAQNGYNGLTNDVFIKQIHSHNDYWRERPLLTALSYGVQSVEADVWNFQSDYNPDDEIYVGHNLNRLSKDRTLDSLYLDPLYTMLEAHNPGDGDTVGGIAERLPSGVFETDIHATLYVFIDFKSEGRALFGKIEDKLARFKEKDWLSHYDTVTGQFIWRPLTVIGTGNTPLESVLAMKDRYIFFDGPLGDLSDERIDHNVSPIASGALRLLVG
ncbi:DEKNAAC103285, partial [Brettanomyces naardenensis]